MNFYFYLIFSLLALQTTKTYGQNSGGSESIDGTVREIQSCIVNGRAVNGAACAEKIDSGLQNDILNSVNGADGSGGRDAVLKKITADLVPSMTAKCRQEGAKDDIAVATCMQTRIGDLVRASAVAQTHQKDLDQWLSGGSEDANVLKKLIDDFPQMRESVHQLGNDVTAARQKNPKS